MSGSTIQVTQFTDPLCAWSWLAEPTLRWLEERYRDQVSIEYVLGGMTGSSEQHTCAFNIADHWQMTPPLDSMPVNINRWLEDPPTHSLPACRAYKAAEFQDPALADQYLRRIREVVATEERNIEEPSFLATLANDVGLNGDRLRRDMTSDRAQAAFEADIKRAREQGVNNFPAFRLEGPAGTEWIYGNQPIEQFKQALAQVAPQSEPQRPRPVDDLIAAHDIVATNEVAAIYETDGARAEQLLKQLETDDKITGVIVGECRFWAAEQPTCLSD